jgi:single-strand DNA-binding protein
VAGSLNKACILGNVGGDPEVRDIAGGKRVANFSVATSESWKNDKGEKQERTEWHRVVCWNDGLVDVIEKYVKKGSKVYIEGEMQTRKWWKRGDEETAENARYSTEVVMTGFNTKLLLCGDSGGGQARDTSGNADRPGNGAGGYKNAREDTSRGSGYAQGEAGNRGLDDDIPF